MSPEEEQEFIRHSLLRNHGQRASALVTIEWPERNYFAMTPEQRLLAPKSMAFLLGLRELYQSEPLDQALSEHPECVLELPDPPTVLGAELI